MPSFQLENPEFNIKQFKWHLQFFGDGEEEGIPQEHKDRQDIELDYLRRSNVLVVCGSRIDEAVKNDIAIAERYRIPATTLSGILTVKSYGQKSLTR